jgi:hypothetical protein
MNEIKLLQRIHFNSSDKDTKIMKSTKLKKKVRGSSVGIATGYGLDSRGIESRWGRDFSRMARPALGPTQPSVQWVPGLSRG